MNDIHWAAVQSEILDLSKMVLHSCSLNLGRISAEITVSYAKA